MVDNVKFNERIDSLTQQGAYTELEYLGHLKELVADLTREMFIKESAWSELSRRNPSIFAKLTEAFIKVLKKIKSFATPDVPTTEVFTDIYTAKRVIIIALNEYAKARALSKPMQAFVEENASGEEKYSLKDNRFNGLTKDKRTTTDDSGMEFEYYRLQQQQQHEKEYADIEAKYFNEDGTEKPGAMLAPNGKRSNLNKQQWVHVRTESFKKWFGEWETLARQQELDDFIDWAVEQQDPRKELVLRDVTQAEINEVLKQGGPDLSGMQHILSAQWVRHALKSHGTETEMVDNDGEQRQLTVEDIKRIPEVLDSYDGLTVQVKAKNKTSIIYSKLLDDGAIEYVERVFETSQKHQPRLITKTAWVKTLDGVKSALPRVYTPERNYSMLFSNGRVNPSSVSKVVDENYEPLVVYHGVSADFNEYDFSKLGKNTQHPTVKLGMFLTADYTVSSFFTVAKYGTEAEKRAILAQLHLERKLANESCYGHVTDMPVHTPERNAIHKAGRQIYLENNFADYSNIMPVFAKISNPLELNWDTWKTQQKMQ